MGCHSLRDRPCRNAQEIDIAPFGTECGGAERSAPATRRDCWRSMAVPNRAPTVTCRVRSLKSSYTFRRPPARQVRPSILTVLVTISCTAPQSPQVAPWTSCGAASGVLHLADPVETLPQALACTGYTIRERAQLQARNERIYC